MKMKLFRIIFLLIIAQGICLSEENNELLYKIGKHLSKNISIESDSNEFKVIKGIPLVHSLVGIDISNQLMVRDVILNFDKRQISRQKMDVSGRFSKPEEIVLPESKLLEIIKPIGDYYVKYKSFPFKNEINIDSLKMVLKQQKIKLELILSDDSTIGEPKVKLVIFNKANHDKTNGFPTLIVSDDVSLIDGDAIWSPIDIEKCATLTYSQSQLIQKMGNPFFKVDTHLEKCVCLELRKLKWSKMKCSVWPQKNLSEFIKSPKLVFVRFQVSTQPLIESNSIKLMIP